MFKLVRHNQPQAWNFQKQPVAITRLMDTEFQWQACIATCSRLPSWLIYEFTSLSLKFSLSEESFQSQVHNTISETRIRWDEITTQASHPPCTNWCSHVWATPQKHLSIENVLGTAPAASHSWQVTPVKQDQQHFMADISLPLKKEEHPYAKLLADPIRYSSHPGWLESHVPMCKPEWLFHL